MRIITTVTAPATATPPAGPYDLTTLANVHSELNLATGDVGQDSFLSRAITQASTAITSHCNRVFAVEGLTDLIYIAQDPYPYQTPGGVAPLQLSRWPVSGVFSAITSADAPSGSVLPFGTTPAAIAGDPVSGLNIAPGTTVLSLGGGNVTLSKPIAGDVPSGSPITFGISVAQTIANGTVQAMVPGTDYNLGPQKGELIRLNPFTGVERAWEALPVTAAYYAGYTTVPSDVEDAALRFVTMRFFARGRDPALREQEQPGSLGRRVWWIGGPPKSGGLPEEIVGLLTPYRVPVAL